MEGNGEDVSVHSEVGNYFFHTKQLHDVHFIVGKHKERIPAVSFQLINQSRVWWSMLANDSPLAEKGDIKLPDFEPDIFRLILKHSYGGLDDCFGLSDEILVELSRCADKYLMSTLKKKIAASLKPRNVDEVFHALHCIAHYNLQTENEAVKRILQTQTMEVFAHPLFLECDEDSVTYITNQDRLGCEEIQLWRAVVKWATSKAATEDGPKLRAWMVRPLQHIRLRTLSKTDLYEHVFSTNILSGSEIASICKKKKGEDNTLCDKTETREISTQSLTWSNEVQPSGTFKVDIKHSIYGWTKLLFQKNTSACIAVKMENIRLKYITCGALQDIRPYTDVSKYFSRLNVYVLEAEYSVDITVTVSRITDLLRNVSEEEPTVINLTGYKYRSFNRFKVPINIVLLANNKYNFELSFGSDFPCWISQNCDKGHEFEHCWFYCSPLYKNGFASTPCHILQFEYNVNNDD